MPLSPHEWAAFTIAVCFAAGLNVYATVATLGLLARAGMVTLPGSLEVVSNWWIIGTCGVMFLLEFVADKIPVFDLVWNVLQTAVRIPVSAVLAFAAAQPLGFGGQVLAAAVGGTIAFAAHSGKLAARTAATASPEPASNFFLSLAEDVFAIGITWFATQHPFLAAAIVLTLVAAIVVSIRWVIRAIRRRRAARLAAVTKLQHEDLKS
jgi:hypothetical protein